MTSWHFYLMTCNDKREIIPTMDLLIICSRRNHSCFVIFFVVGYRQRFRKSSKNNNNNNEFSMRPRYKNFKRARVGMAPNPPCQSAPGLNLSNTLKNQLDKYGLKLFNCRGQSYDNGSNMIGLYKGEQS